MNETAIRSDPPVWAIRVTKVVKRFGDRTVLDGVSLDIPAGQTAVIVGPSGGGKSTLLRCLNGLADMDAGEIQVGEHRLAAGNRIPSAKLRAVRQSFGMIFQDFQLFPHLTVLANVIEAPMRVRRLGREEATTRARELLRRVGMLDHERKFPGQLSGGQKQRVAIARALAMEPRGLLCDEITSALDPKLKAEVISVLRDLKQDRLTLIAVTHELGFAKRVADRVIGLFHGQVREDGPAEAVLSQPQTSDMREFLDEAFV
jgi:ABC-type polar amino acid transport system ATPase subunit